jgi:PIN domain nuclease of toxin-antitoxin system
MMVTRKRIQLAVSLESFLQAVESTFIVLPITGATARRSMEFTDRYPGDPMDRIIGATALVEGLSLITRDDAIRASKEVPCVW